MSCICILILASSHGRFEKIKTRWMNKVENDVRQGSCHLCIVGTKADLARDHATRVCVSQEVRHLLHKAHRVRGMRHWWFASSNHSSLAHASGSELNHKCSRPRFSPTLPQASTQRQAMANATKDSVGLGLLLVLACIYCVSQLAMDCRTSLI